MLKYEPVNTLLVHLLTSLKHSFTVDKTKLLH